MAQAVLNIGFDSLPRTLPVFPLAGALLLPGEHLHVTVSEVRYLHLVEDALAARDRMMGMILPRKEEELYHTGCAGRITRFEEMLDGSILLTLTGFCRFDIGQEMPTTRGYRRVVAVWSKYQDDLHINPNPEVDRIALLKLLANYLKLLAIQTDWDSIARAPTSSIISFFAANLPFEDRDKQALLEAPQLEDRAHVLISLIQMALAENGELATTQ